MQSEAQNNVQKDTKSSTQKDIADEAQDVLYESQDVVLQTRKAVASTYASPLLVLWGFLWGIAYLASYFYINYAFRIFMFMALVGGLGTALIFRSRRIHHVHGWACVLQHSGFFCLSM